MWSKLSHALKSRVEPEPPINTRYESSHSSVMSRVLDQHPNLSVFHPSDTTMPAPSPPSSPSKHGRLGLFKRTSKFPKNDSVEGLVPLKLPVPSQVKSALHLNTNSSNISLPLPSADTLRTSFESPRPSPDSLPPHTPIDINRGSGSVRSIMREKNTPGTGQNVRFFSRDAYKVISPDPSFSTSSEPSEPPLLQRLQQVTIEGGTSIEETRYHSAFASPGNFFSSPRSAPLEGMAESPAGFPSTLTSRSMTSLLVPIPPPDLSDIFDLSQDHEVKAILMNEDGPLQDNAVEITEFEETVPEQDENPDVAGAKAPKTNGNLSSTEADLAANQTKSLGRKAGEAVFRSMTNRSTTIAAMRSSSSLGLNRVFSNHNNGDVRSSAGSNTSTRSRSMSETILHRPARASPSDHNSVKVPEQDINDLSAQALVVYGDSEPPDPFRANATTYYTPETMIPNSPPRSHHTKTDSNGNISAYSYTASSYLHQQGDDDVVRALRTELALQNELSAQYEIDLSARDELVESLTEKLDNAEREMEKRRGVMRGWKKKVGELERAYRGLEEEVGKSRQESFERSIMDEASSEALRQLHRQIGMLEREKGEVEKREEALLGDREKLNSVVKEKEEQIESLKNELARGADMDRSPDRTQENAEAMRLLAVQEVELKALVLKGEQAFAMEQDKHRDAEFTWGEERAQLMTRLDELQRENASVVAESADVREQLSASVNEVSALKSEVEAQWRNMEAASEKVGELEQERDSLRRDLETLEARATEMEIEWTESENRRAEMEMELNEAWGAKQDLEKDRDQLSEDLSAEREKLAQLRNEIESQGNEITTLGQERQYALDNVTRLEGMLHQRDAEIAEYSQKVITREQETEELQSELSRLKREHGRLVDEQGRSMNEVAWREEDARKKMEDAVQKKAEADVTMATLKERITTMKEEVEKLRRHVHDLQQESADKEVKVVQLTKQRDQDKEDKVGLNIALDSKQQELELLKRRLGVRGTGGSTPGPPTRVKARRESGTFTTPIPMRPASALSDSGKESKQAEPHSIGKPAIPALGKSVRANGGSSGSTSIVPSTVKATRFVEGSMGPPPARPRSSVLSTASSTPTQMRTSSSLSRSMSSRPSLPGTPSTIGPLRRTSSSSLTRGGNVSDASSAQDEKENVRPSTKTPGRRASMLPTPA